MKLLREPLLHFLVLGAGLFLLFGLVNRSEKADTARIVVTAGQIDQLAENWTRIWMRPPTPDELDGLIDDYVREEVYYREALAMGLDRDDPVIRARLRQKVEFLTDDLAAAADPSEEQLEDFLADNPESFRADSRLSFEHIYLSREKRGDAAQRDAETLLARLEGAGTEVDPAALGDPMLLPREYQRASSRDIASRFGEEFAKRLEELPVGRWAGPVESSYGLHLVLVRERTPGRIPALVEVREAVKREWRAARSKEATEAFYQRLRAQYTVVVEAGARDGDAGVPTVSEARP